MLNKSSIIRYDFWCWCFDIEFWAKIINKVNEQTIETIFNAFDEIVRVNFERRDDFDATIEREIISI